MCVCVYVEGVSADGSQENLTLTGNNALAAALSLISHLPDEDAVQLRPRFALLQFLRCVQRSIRERVPLAVREIQKNQPC